MSNSEISENKNEDNEVKAQLSENKDSRPVCGLIMPIADTEGYPLGHWKDVKEIITKVAEDAGFRTRLVSDSDAVRVIQKNIVQNIFEDDIVICDVSSRNPNVMFELGLRFAFDKPAVIIKDNETPYSFDTSPVQHLNYPKDLRYVLIEKFKKELKSKLLETYKQSKEEGHSMYLHEFGKIVAKKLTSEEVSKDVFILEKLKDMELKIDNINTNQYSEIQNSKYKPSYPSSMELEAFVMQCWGRYVRSIDTNDEIGVFVNYVNMESQKFYHTTINPTFILGCLDKNHIPYVNNQ